MDSLTRSRSIGSSPGLPWPSSVRQRRCEDGVEKDAQRRYGSIGGIITFNLVLQRREIGNLDAARLNCDQSASETLHHSLTVGCVDRLHHRGCAAPSSVRKRR